MTTDNTAIFFLSAVRLEESLIWKGTSSEQDQ